MSYFLDTTGQKQLSVAICDRCKMKRMIGELTSDPNSPGLRVCKSRGCLDEYDPWRLPARTADQTTIQHPRPDVSVAVT